MIFVIVGSQMFQFNRLLEEIDTLIELEVINEEVYAQIGCSTYIPKNYSYKNFLDRTEFKAYMEKSSKVITHAGTGAIIGAIKLGKKVIAVPRQSKYGEHIDDHQIQIVEQFAQMGIIMPCFCIQDLEDAYQKLESKEFEKYISNTEKIIANIDKYVRGL